MGKNYYKNNRETILQKLRERYANDAEYRERKLESNRAYHRRQRRKRLQTVIDQIAVNMRKYKQEKYG